MRRVALIAAGLIIVGATALYFRPLPSIQPTDELTQPSNLPAVSLPWPQSKQSAMGAIGYGVLATNGRQGPLPMASITKLVTALAVLNKHPITNAQSSPTITLSERDEGYYQDYASKDGSVVKVISGEQISEYQALQAMLLPSANNIADTLAVWSFGSVENYLEYANKFVASLNMPATTIADASGFSPASVSSTSDLVRLGGQALANPILAGIVAQKQADVPVAGTVTNTNWLLGSSGIIGIKTGHTDESGGCFLFASKQMVTGQPIILVGAILGSSDLKSAVDSSTAIIASTVSGFELKTVAKTGQTVGRYTTPWGDSSDAVAKNDLTFLGWKGAKQYLGANLTPLHPPAKQDIVVGELKAVNGSYSKKTSVVLKQKLPAPSWHWRIFRR